MGTGEHARLRKSLSNRRRRAARREFLRTATTVDKHVLDVDCWARSTSNSSQPEKRPTRTNSRIFTTVRIHYDSSALLTIGYGLHVVHEKDGDRHLGFGLKTSVDIPNGSPITQYEGEILSSGQASNIHKTDPSRCSHFATAIKGGPVINGFQRIYDEDRSLSSGDAGIVETACVPYIGKCGDPLVLPFSALKEKRGDSFASHCSKGDKDGPNAAFQPDRFIGKAGVRDGTSLFLIAIRNIKAGEFIRVNYGTMFTNSSKTNIM